MATLSYSHLVCHKNLISSQKKSAIFHGINPRIHTISTRDQLTLFRLKASKDEPSPKKSVLICPDCDANGAVQCSQCKGTGVNLVDHFNGQFKAGDSCWLCGGRKDMLCGNCQGAGFLGGFMTDSDT